jgi:serine O-acetyltransferase
MMNERLSTKRLPEATIFVENDGRSNLNPKGIGFFALVAEDYQCHGREFFSPGFWTLFWHRFGNWRMGVKTRVLRAPLSILYRFMNVMVHWIAGIELPYTVKVGRRVILEHFGGMILVAQSIGDDVTIRQNTTFGIARLEDRSGRPVIGNAVEIGAGAVILGRVAVGEDSVIGANAVVVRSVPPLAVVGGVPAKLIRIRTRDEADRSRMLRLQIPKEPH